MNNIVFQNKDLQSVLNFFEASISKKNQTVLAFKDLTLEDKRAVNEYAEANLKRIMKKRNKELVPIHITLGNDPSLISQHIINQVYDNLVGGPYWKELPFDLRRLLISSRNNGLEKTTIREDDINRVSREIRKMAGVDNQETKNFDINIKFVDAGLASAGAGGGASSTTTRTNQSQNVQTRTNERKVSVDTEYIPLDQIDMIHRLGVLLSRVSGTPVLFYSPGWEKFMNWYTNQPNLAKILPKVREISNSCLVQFVLFPFILLWEVLKFLFYPLWLVAEVLLNMTVVIIKILPDFLSFKLKRRIQIMLILEGVGGDAIFKDDSAMELLQYLLCNPYTLFFLFMDGKFSEKFN